MPLAVIIDCGIGNLFSIQRGLQKTGLKTTIASTTEELKTADAIILPGVGNFKAGSQNLQALGEELTSTVADGIPLFGVCLGMQLLFEESEESPGTGLSLLKGKVLRLTRQVKTPHMGWNTLNVTGNPKLLEGIGAKDYFYFVHSYYALPADWNTVVAETSYGVNFASVVAKKNVYGTQFHPEKSGKPGGRVLRNFANVVKK